MKRQKINNVECQFSEAGAWRHPRRSRRRLRDAGAAPLLEPEVLERDVVVKAATQNPGGFIRIPAQHWIGSVGRIADASFAEMQAVASEMVGLFAQGASHLKRADGQGSDWIAGRMSDARIWRDWSRFPPLAEPRRNFAALAQLVLD